MGNRGLSPIILQVKTVILVRNETDLSVIAALNQVYRNIRQDQTRPAGHQLPYVKTWRKDTKKKPWSVPYCPRVHPTYRPKIAYKTRFITRAGVIEDHYGT